MNYSISHISNNAVEVEAMGFYSSYCSQLNSYFINAGIIIIIIAIAIHWFNWWFFNYAYKKLESEKYRKYFEDINNRIYWDNWIKARLMKLLIGYIAVVIFFNL